MPLTYKWQLHYTAMRSCNTGSLVPLSPPFSTPCPYPLWLHCALLASARFSWLTLFLSHHTSSKKPPLTVHLLLDWAWMPAWAPAGSHCSWFSWVPHGQGLLLEFTLLPVHSLRGTHHGSGGSVLDKERGWCPRHGLGTSSSAPAGLDCPVVRGGCEGPLGRGRGACRSWTCA